MSHKKLRNRYLRALRMERVSRRAKRWDRVRYWRAVKLRARKAYQKAKLAHMRATNQHGFQPWMLNGRAGNINDACKRFIVRAVNAGLVVTSTTGGRHATNSYHYPSGGAGRAVDVAGTWNEMVAFQKAEANNPTRYNELFGPSNAHFVKNGSRYSIGEGAGLENQHDNHVHGAPRR